jgi:hypothetical protein
MCKETTEEEEALPQARVSVKMFDSEVRSMIDTVLFDEAKYRSTERRLQAKINKSQVVKRAVQGIFGNVRDECFRSRWSKQTNM